MLTTTIVTTIGESLGMTTQETHEKFTPLFFRSIQSLRASIFVLYVTDTDFRLDIEEVRRIVAFDSKRKGTIKQGSHDIVFVPDLKIT